MFEAIIRTLVPSPLQTIYLAITAFIIGAAIGVDERTNHVKAIVSIIKMLILWIIGGLVYVSIEILYRGYSHWTMFIVGGVCFIEIGVENELMPTWDIPIEIQAFIGAIIITLNEFICGCIINIGYGLHVWDYSGLPFNVLGQICLPFTIAWFFIAIIAIVVDDKIRYTLFREELPHYDSLILKRTFYLTTNPDLIKKCNRFA